MKDSWAPIYLDKNEKFEFIDELITGKIPALILKKAFSLNLCKKITEKILDFNHISSGPGIDKKIGESLNSFINQKDIYFEKTKFVDNKLEEYFLHIEDPRVSMQYLLSLIFAKNTILAKENNSNYSKGVLGFMILMNRSTFTEILHIMKPRIIVSQIFLYNSLRCYIYNKQNVVVN